MVNQYLRDKIATETNQTLVKTKKIYDQLISKDQNIYVV